jgi:hypothetical protein
MLAFQSFEALKSMAQGTASTIFVPTDAVGVMASLGSISSMFKSTQGE